MKTKEIVSPEEVRRLFEYQDGQLIRKITRTHSAKAGDRCGSMGKRGYEVVNIRKRLYYVHRVIFAVVYGRWPAGFLDHINGIKTDNRIENLREASNAQNIQAAKRLWGHNTTGFRGICRQGKLWRAKLKANGVVRQLGYFHSAEEAAKAYDAGARKYFGAFAYQNFQ